MENNKSYLGIDGVLAIVFVVLKLCGLINWSWWWVLSPLWISLSVGVVAIVVALIGRWWRTRGKASTKDNPVMCQDCLFAEYNAQGKRFCGLSNIAAYDNCYCDSGVRR